MSLSIAMHSAGPGRVQPAQSLQSLSVLVVDDEEDQFVLVRRLLAPFSSPRFDVVWAESYSSGLGHLERRRFDVCLVDYRLGQMNGVQLIAEARTRRPDMPFILVTGRGDRDVDMQAMAAGAIDYLSKTTLDGPTLERAIRYATTEQALLNVVERVGAHIEALDEVGQALAIEGPSASGLDRVLGVMDLRLGHSCAAIYLLAGDQLTLGAVHGFVRPAASAPAESGPLGRVLKDGHALIIPTWTEVDVDSHSGCEYTVPLLFEDRRVGVLTVAVSAEQQLDDSDQRALLDIGIRVGNAVGLHQERTWLAERRLALRRTSSFAEAALREPIGPDHLDRILARLQGVFRADGYALAEATPDGTLVVRSALGILVDRLGDTIGQAHSPAARARDHRTVQVDSTGMSCAAFGPVVVGSELLGLLWVDRRGMDAEYSALETDVLALLGTELGVVIALARERAGALRSGVRDETTGLFTRAFLDGLLETAAAIDGTAAGPFGLVVAAPRSPDRVSRKDEQRILESLISVASAQVAGRADIVAHYGATSLAILVREQALVRTATLAKVLADVSEGAGMVEVSAGWAVRSGDSIASLAIAAEMALELSRRTRTVVEA